MENCKLDTQFVDSSLIGYDFVTGGFFPVIFWGTLVGVTYVRYRNAALSAMVGATIAMSSTILIPESAGAMILLMISSAIAVSLYYIIARAKRPGQ